MKVYKTKDYDRFKRILGNRELDDAHLKNLERSILKHNFLYLYPIIVGKGLEIIDGQHRLEVARKNNLDIYYIIDEDKLMSPLEKAILINSNMRSWIMKNYLHSHIERGNQNYQILEDFMKKYELPVSVSMYLLEGGLPDAKGRHKNSRGEVVQRFKEGTFVAKKIKYAINLAEKLSLIKPFLENGIWKERKFLRAYQVATKTVSCKQFASRYAKTGLRIRRQATMKDYLRVLEDNYNFRLSEKNRVRLF